MKKFHIRIPEKSSLLDIFISKNTKLLLKVVDTVDKENIISQLSYKCIKKRR